MIATTMINDKSEYSKSVLIFIILIIVFYPMLISIYVFPPLLIGVVSYILYDRTKTETSKFLFAAIAYMFSLEVNLSLPVFLIVISTLLFYILLHPYMKYFRICKVCKAILSVILLDMSYLGCLFFYDFIFQTQSIILDGILLYSLIVDILIVAIL